MHLCGMRLELLVARRVPRTQRRLADWASYERADCTIMYFLDGNQWDITPVATAFRVTLKRTGDTVRSVILVRQSSAFKTRLKMAPGLRPEPTGSHISTVKPQFRLRPISLLCSLDFHLASKINRSAMDALLPTVSKIETL